MSLHAAQAPAISRSPFLMSPGLGGSRRCLRGHHSPGPGPTTQEAGLPHAHGPAAEEPRKWLDESLDERSWKWVCDPHVAPNCQAASPRSSAPASRPADACAPVQPRILDQETPSLAMEHSWPIPSLVYFHFKMTISIDTVLVTKTKIIVENSGGSSLSLKSGECDQLCFFPLPAFHVDITP